MEIRTKLVQGLLIINLNLNLYFETVLTLFEFKLHIIYEIEEYKNINNKNLCIV